MEKKRKKKMHRNIRDALHHYGIPYSALDNIDDYVTTTSHAITPHLAALSAETKHEGDLISEDHRDLVLETAQLQITANQVRKLLSESIVPSGPKVSQVATFIMKPEVASHVLAGAALGFSFETVAHILDALWSRISDFQHGRNINLKEVRRYATAVRRHADARTRQMIKDLKIALERADWVKATQIQRQIYEYGKKVGLHEDGAMGGGAPVNNVGGGHIAGAAGDPPGPKSKLTKKIIRRKPPIMEGKVSTFKSITKPARRIFIKVAKKSTPVSKALATSALAATTAVGLHKAYTIHKQKKEE